MAVRVLGADHTAVSAALHAVWDTWLDQSNQDADALAKLLVPAPDDLLEAYPVGFDVSNVRNNGDHLVTPLEGHVS